MGNWEQSAKSILDGVNTRRKGLLLAATSLINFLGLTRSWVQSIAPTGPHECPHFPLFPTLLSEPDFNIGRL